MEEVDINRSTFYLHYTDIYDLLEQTENDLKNEILEIVNNDQRLRMEETMPYITELFVFIADNREIASALLDRMGMFRLMRQIESDYFKSLYEVSEALSGTIG